MKFGIIGDIHGNLDYLNLALEKSKELGVDTILCVGDFSKIYVRHFSSFETTAKYYADIDTVFQKLNESDVPWYFVPGNHDLKDYFNQSNNIDRKLVTIGGLNFFGIGGSFGEKFSWPYECDDSEISNFPENVDFIVSHGQR